MRPIARRLKSRCDITTVVLADEPNDDGEQDETTTTVTDVPCLVDQHHSREGGVSENAAKQEVARELSLLFLGPDEVINQTSKITYQGNVYEVDGFPSFEERDGRIHHIQVYMARTL